MIHLSTEEADAFAHEWAAAWNSHDLHRIASHYRDDVVYYSPFADRLGAATPFSGRTAFSRYAAAALELLPGPSFRP